MEGSSFSSSSAPSVDSLLGAENDGLRVSDRIPLLLLHTQAGSTFGGLKVMVYGPIASPHRSPRFPA